MIPDKLKKRLSAPRRMVPVTVRMPADVIESMKIIAPRKGLTGYQTLLKSYVSDGLRRDEAEYLFTASTARLVEALRRHGVSSEVIEEATREAEEA